MAKTAHFEFGEDPSRPKNENNQGLLSSTFDVTTTDIFAKKNKLPPKKWPKMHILNSEGTHLDQKLTNYRGPKTSTFHVERPLQRYLLKTVLHRGGIQLWVGALQLKYKLDYKLNYKLNCSVSEYQVLNRTHMAVFIVFVLNFDP